MDTIFALATARGRAGVAVIRVSGPQAADAARALAGDCPPARQALLRVLRDLSGSRLDEGIVLYFEDGASFTGEPVVEFQIHGSLAAVSAVLQALGAIDGLRPAEAGEFTRRAMENGRLDLTQVEGLAALIDAETEAQRRQALRTLQGALRDRTEAWRTDLTRAVALLEATIDFVDEDVPVDVTPEVTELLGRTIEELRKEIAGSAVAERIRDGFEVAIIGPPNAGKSTLLNRIAKREAAITSSIAGTTRDVIEVRMDLHGLPVTLLGTAGLRVTEDQIEKLGVDRTRQRAASADVRLFLSCAAEEVRGLDQPGDIHVKGKSDLSGGSGVSGLTGEGVDELLAGIGKELERRVGLPMNATHERHAQALRDGLAHLEQAVETLASGSDTADVGAFEIHSALHALDVLLGRVDVEAVLDHIFGSFCIGK